jgi:hypothetical protein
MEHWDEISILVVIPVMTSEHQNPSSGSLADSVEWAKEQLKQVPDVARRAAYVREIEEFSTEISKGPPPLGPDGMDLDTEKQIYEQMAKGLGIDLDDPNDQLGMAVRIGIADRSPERVLKDCKHLFVKVASRGMVARMMQLDTAGFKSIECTLHNKGIQGFSLDDTYRVFSQMHCSKCPDASPHPPDWKWTKDYQQAQHDLHGKPKPLPPQGNVKAKPTGPDGVES